MIPLPTLEERVAALEAQVAQAQVVLVNHRNRLDAFDVWRDRAAALVRRFFQKMHNRATTADEL